MIFLDKPDKHNTITTLIKGHKKMTSNKNTKLYRRYVGITPDERKEKIHSELIGFPMALFIMGNIIWLFGQSNPTRVTGQRNRMYKPYKAAIHDAYIPTDKYIIDENTYNTGQLKVNPNPKFKANGLWLANLILSLFLFIGSAYVNTENKRDLATVDMMVDLEKFGKIYNLNTRQVKQLVKKSSNIIAKMSKENHVYFDMIINGKIDINKDKTFVDMAVAILDGYLRAHPEEEAGILSVFAENKPLTEKLKKVLAVKYR